MRTVENCPRIITKYSSLTSPLVSWGGVVGCGAKVMCILHHWGVQLILAYSWARPGVLVASKGRGECFYFFFTFIPVPLSSLSLSLISSTISFLPFSGRPQYNQKTSGFYTFYKVWTNRVSKYFSAFVGVYSEGHLFSLSDK